MAFPPIPLIRRGAIISSLRRHGAVSEETAMTFAEAGIINPGWFRAVTNALVRRRVIARVGEDRYYLVEK